MESNNLFRKFPTPQWLNNQSVRNAGVYLGGALVSQLPALWWKPAVCCKLWNLPSFSCRATSLINSQFSLGFFTFLDAAVYSHSQLNGSTIHITFVDWLPLICSFLGLLITSSLEKSRLSADSFSYSGNGVAWKARLVLFLGFALIAGGLAGSVCVLVLKFVVREGNDEGVGEGFGRGTMWMGIANVLSNALVMLSCIVLWVSQNMEDEYTYNLAL